MEYRTTSILKQNYKKIYVSRKIPQCGSFDQIKEMIGMKISLQSAHKNKHGFELLPKIRRMRFHVYDKGDNQRDKK